MRKPSAPQKHREHRNVAEVGLNRAAVVTIRDLRVRVHDEIAQRIDPGDRVAHGSKLNKQYAVAPDGPLLVLDDNKEHHNETDYAEYVAEQNRKCRILDVHSILCSFEEINRWIERKIDRKIER